VATDEQRADFARVFAQLSPRVFAYARRQVDAAAAEDVVADTFLVAWRRWDDLPAAPLPWLLVVARNTLANRRRSELRRDRMTDAAGVFARLTEVSAGADDDVVERDAVLRALADLSPLEREALLLVAWDGLAGRDAARVAGCTLRAFEVRLSRARARVRRSLAADVADIDDIGDTPFPQLREVR
jgi:RNA polymerase sigma factor (sigma-70 family)